MVLGVSRDHKGKPRDEAEQYALCSPDAIASVPTGAATLSSSLSVLRHFVKKTSLSEMPQGRTMQAGLRRPSSARNPGQIVFRSRMSHLCDKPDRGFVTETMRQGREPPQRRDRLQTLSVRSRLETACANSTAGVLACVGSVPDLRHDPSFGASAAEFICDHTLRRQSQLPQKPAQ